MSETRRPRRPTEGGYARGDETRRKIIDAAIHLFGQHGFAGASTRDIAARAGVNAPALQYYFENKEGLYCACAESLADDAWSAIEPQVQNARALLERHGKIDELIEAFIQLQNAVADLMFKKGDDTDKRLFFAREQGGGEPEMGAQILRERMRDPLNQVTVALLAHIAGMSEDDPLTVVRTFSLYGQFLLFHFARESTLSMLEWREIDVEKAAFLKAAIGDQTRVLLKHWYDKKRASKE
ncbi:CerR family C-terminal domain-containing protein [Paraburkholderia sp. J67]|uniref:CerR family C-terminal domain-containing protein n=1 Tax=Paraburkholderia sp. J67 TaxID=2805435 RepID=UPI002ABD55F0|nr:CerR family C-terminal domain-containing protein [Paraburkholderia sp. J67]